MQPFLLVWDLALHFSKAQGHSLPNNRIFLEDGVITGCITAVILNLIFNGYREKEMIGKPDAEAAVSGWILPLWQ